VPGTVRTTSQHHFERRHCDSDYTTGHKQAMTLRKYPTTFLDGEMLKQMLVKDVLTTTRRQGHLFACIPLDIDTGIPNQIDIHPSLERVISTAEMKTVRRVECLDYLTESAPPHRQ
jgi:hypothetical protein